MGIQYTAWDVDDLSKNGRALAIGGYALDGASKKAVVMYYGPGQDDEYYLEPLKYQWVDSITVNGLTVQLIGVNTISCKEQTENSDWSVFGTFEEDWGTHQTERTSSGKGLILFHQVEGI